ncbi:hypothetical protein A6R68_23099 [Neotoma lepida]|uniref:Uncharacterized protein n=1 Tax=Neotoma lepida TaxID=56216 RepID=A0A1A6HY30_NEOLE|nr:hypothetical protein A6R68_23099 [Neotoma lepida]
MKPRFHKVSGRFSQRGRMRAVSQKATVHGLCLYMILCFGLGLGLGFSLGLDLNPGFGLNLGLGLGTGLSIRLGRSLDLPQMASLDIVHQESTNNVAMGDSSVVSIMEVMDENLGQISDVKAVSQYEFDNWENVHEDTRDEAVKEGAEDGQGNHQTTET